MSCHGPEEVILPPQELEITYELDSHLNNTSEYFVVFGDIQEYTKPNDNLIQYYDSSINWITEQVKAGAKIVNILQTGDVTNDNEDSQWQLFFNSTEAIAKDIPYMVCTGNHDYTWDAKQTIYDRATTKINNYAHFPLTDQQIVTYYSGQSLENYVARLSDSEGVYLLVLEFCASKAVVEWANSYVESHPDDTFILMTHEWLVRRGVRVEYSTYAKSEYADYETYSSPEEIWNMLVKKNNNVLCVLCGHAGFTGRYFTDNEAGRSVPQLMFNLQYQENGGNGLVQLWEIPADNDSVRICAYDTINREWFMTDSTFVSFRYKNYSGLD